MSLPGFSSDYVIDKILSDFDGNTTNHTVGAATLSGGLYLPKTDTLTITNPISEKALITMIWSIDGTNFYPQKARLYQPGNPVPTGKIGATVGAAVDASNIYFYFTHYYGSSQDFTLFWTLDGINLDDVS
jgi:hypothetical protein